MDKKELRTRITQEDTLLGSRTEAFLLGSGFLMTALGISDVDFEKSAIGVLGLFISLIWFLVGWQSRLLRVFTISTIGNFRTMR